MNAKKEQGKEWWRHGKSHTRESALEGKYKTQQIKGNKPG